jgi:hypothetical protein
MFEQATFPVQNEPGFQQLAQRIEAAFRCQSRRPLSGLGSRQRAESSPVRESAGQRPAGQGFDRALQGLPISDQAMIREKYLAKIEKVPVELRQRFLKIYAYY